MLNVEDLEMENFNEDLAHLDDLTYSLAEVATGLPVVGGFNKVN